MNFAIVTFSTTMDNILEGYSRLMALAGRDSVLSDPTIGFEQLCRIAGVAFPVMDSYVFSELGLSGDELINRFRQQYFDSKDKK
jgi:hypothetical protein